MTNPRAIRTTCITLHLPYQTPLASLRNWAAEIGCTLRQRSDGSYVAVPTASNANRVKIPRRHRQYVHADLPTGPEAA